MLPPERILVRYEFIGASKSIQILRFKSTFYSTCTRLSQIQWLETTASIQNEQVKLQFEIKI